MTVEQAGKHWLAELQANYSAPSTIRKYHYVTGLLAKFFSDKPLPGISPADLQRFRARRKVSAHTAYREMQIIKTFLAFCEERGFVAVSPARKLKPPRFQRSEIRPYTQEEIISILQAVSFLKVANYPRLRCTAALLVMRHHGLRVSDAVGLRRDAVSQVEGQWRLRLRTKKTGAQIDHLVPGVVLEALERIPKPHGDNCAEYFFWNGRGTIASCQTNMENSLREAYRLSGVKGAHNHRFRHTRASEILLAGGSLHDCALALGISDRIVEKSYSRFMPEQRERLDLLMVKATARIMGIEHHTLKDNGLQ